MKTYIIRLLSCLFSLGFLFGCLQKDMYPPLPTAGHVDLQRYAGRWYEIARYPHRFEKGCTNVTADYTLQTGGSIRVINQCRLKDKEGAIKKAVGKAKVVDRTTNAKLKVTFFWPFYGDYWILEIDPDYQYAIVGEPSRKYVWILGRAPRMEPFLLATLVEKIRRFGYDPNRLIFTQNTDTI